MNKPLWFLYDSLETEASLNRLIFKSGIAPSIEESLNRLHEKKDITAEQLRLLQYFFKAQAACDKLLNAAFKGLERESKSLLGSNKSIAWKQKELSIRAKLLSSVIHQLGLYAKIDANALRKFKKVKSKIILGSGKPLSEYRDAVKKFQDTTTKQIDSKKILTEDDWLKEWSAMYEKNQIHPDQDGFQIQLTQDEILFYHLFSLYNQIYRLCDLFTRQFRKEFHFTMVNIIKRTPIAILQEKVKISESVKHDLLGIFKIYVPEKSQGALDAFFEGEELTDKIEFLRSKNELLSVFLLLYKNKLIGPSPKRIAHFVASSFRLPKSSRGTELNADRVREFICRKGKYASTTLPEIQELAISRNLKW